MLSLPWHRQTSGDLFRRFSWNVVAHRFLNGSPVGELKPQEMPVRTHRGDIGGKKYSPLDQIGASNFADLEIAWEWTSVDTLISRSTPGGGERGGPHRLDS